MDRPRMWFERSEVMMLGAGAPSSKVGRRGLLWSTTSAAWLRPVGVPRGTRAPDQSANPTTVADFTG
jgi:hypothetical protein